jgi:hypothetical protein
MENAGFKPQSKVGLKVLSLGKGLGLKAGKSVPVKFCLTGIKLLFHLHS